MFQIDNDVCPSHNLLKSKNMKHKGIVVIGDVHGRDQWRKAVRKAKTSRIVFLGDYVDPYDSIEPDDLIENLKAIITLKKENPDRVVLLLGNHDMHYIYEDFTKGSRYDKSLAEAVSQIFNENRDLFQFAYQEGNTVITHAGISSDWFREDFKGDKTRDIAEQLNNPTPEQLKAMFQAGRSRFGPFKNGGIFWADMSETARHPLCGIHQVVGHSQVEHVSRIDINTETSITFCDCLKNNEWLELRG